MPIAAIRRLQRSAARVVSSDQRPKILADLHRDDVLDVLLSDHPLHPEPEAVDLESLLDQVMNEVLNRAELTEIEEVDTSPASGLPVSASDTDEAHVELPAPMTVSAGAVDHCEEVEVDGVTFIQCHELRPDRVDAREVMDLRPPGQPDLWPGRGMWNAQIPRRLV